jgi:hypothetical protein
LQCLLGHSTRDRIKCYLAIVSCRQIFRQLIAGVASGQLEVTGDVDTWMAYLQHMRFIWEHGESIIVEIDFFEYFDPL